MEVTGIHGYEGVSGFIQSTNKFLYRRILHADDTPHRIALGVGLATFVAFTPTMGLQTVIALGLAALLRANKAVCIPFVWITNPVTFGPIYAACWWLGAYIVPGGRGADFAAIQERLNVASAHGEGWLTNLFSYDFWAGMVGIMIEFGWELWVGCCVVGLFSGIVLYFATLWFIVAYRTRRQARKMRRHEQRQRFMRDKKRLVAAAGKSS